MTETSGGRYLSARNVCTVDIEHQRGQRQQEDNKELHFVASDFLVGELQVGEKRHESSHLKYHLNFIGWQGCWLIT